MTNWTATPSVATTVSEALESDMTEKIKSTDRVLVLDENSAPIGYINSVRDTALRFHATEDTVKKYIRNGTFWKKKKVFLDLAR